MKRFIIALSLISIIACKETTKSAETNDEKSEEAMIESAKNYPQEVTAIFEAHGGLNAWRANRTLSYIMPKPNGDEQQTIDLYSRNEKIETPNFSMGYDGKDFWLADENEAYKGNPIFYHNLMFYFYAMPFVLADDGINFSETQNLDFEGKSYPGIRVSYDDGVGVSSKDEYYLHYDPDTNQMAWLGYTVTYRSGEKSDNVKWIRYDDWLDVNGLILPNSMTWHKVEEGKIGVAASTRKFTNVMLSAAPNSTEFYTAPENAKIVTKE